MKVKSTILLARIVLVIAFYPFGIKYIDFISNVGKGKTVPRKRSLVLMKRNLRV